MGDSWEDDDFSAPVVIIPKFSTISVTKNSNQWNDDADDDGDHSSEQIALKTPQLLMVEHEPNPKVKKEDIGKEIHSKNQTLTNADISGINFSLKLFEIPLKNKHDHSNFGTMCAMKITGSKPPRIATIFKTLSKLLEGKTVPSTILDELITVTTKIRDEKVSLVPIAKSRIGISIAKIKEPNEKSNVDNVIQKQSKTEIQEIECVSKLNNISDVNANSNKTKIVVEVSKNLDCYEDDFM